MYKCNHCQAEFNEPERMVIGIHQNEILIVCPKCGDGRITYIWDEPKGKENKKEK